MIIVGIIFFVILTVMIILMATLKVEVSGDIKKDFAIPEKKKYPNIYVKDCVFYAPASSKFEYSDDEINQILSSLDECFQKEDYDRAISLSEEIIKVECAFDRAWTRNIEAVFCKVIRNDGCWSEGLSRKVINSCFGFLQCYETVIEKSRAAKHILLPILIKYIEELINYQNKNVTKYHNLEVYNMMINLYYVTPYKKILTLLTNNLLNDMENKEFVEDDYVKQTLKILLKQVDMVETHNSSRLQENVDAKKIANCTLNFDEKIAATIVAFELTFAPGKKFEKIEASFFDENGDEIFLGKEKEKYIETFEAVTDIGTTSKEEIVLFAETPISMVKLRIYEENINNKPIEEKLEESNNSDDKKNDTKQDESQLLVYPRFDCIKEIAISDTQFVALKENGTVIVLGITNSLNQQTNTWCNIKKVYSKGEAIYAIREDGTVIYAGNSKYENIEEIYNWKNVKKLSFGDKHLVGITENSVAYALGDNTNGECNVSDWYDVIQVDTSYHTVGVCKNGNVIAIGENNFGECDVRCWKDIVQVAAGDFFTLGLTSSGKVLATGLNSCGQCNVDEWANIKKVFAAGNMGVGLRYDGKVVISGKNSYYYGDIKNWLRTKNIFISKNRIASIEHDGTTFVAGKPYKNFANGKWTDVKRIVMNNDTIIALKENGTLVSNNPIFGNYISDDFSNISQIYDDISNNRIAMVNNQGVVTINDKVSENSNFEDGYPSFYDVKKVVMNNEGIFMVKNDGTCVYMKFTSRVLVNIPEWSNLVDISAGESFLIGLDLSGKVVAFGENNYGQCNVSDWNDIVKIAARGKRAMALSIDGNMFMSGMSEFGEDDFIKISKNIKDFALTDLQVMILENDGTVKITYHPVGVDIESVNEWKNIKKIVARGNNFLCLSEDGKVYSTINNEVEISKWVNVEDIDASGNYVWATLKKATT